MEKTTFKEKVNSVREGMPIHSVRTCLVFIHKMRLCEFGKNRKEGTGCYAMFTDGDNTIKASYLDGIVYRLETMKGGASC